VGNDAALGTGQLSLSPDNGSTSGSGTILAYGGARTIANAINYPSGTNNSTLIVGGTNNITFTANIDLNGLDNTGNPGSRTITVNNTGATTFSGNLSDSSANAIGFVKNGTGGLYLNGANTFAGVTTNSAGLLAGNGTLAGSVLVTTNASIGAGAATGIGTLTISGNLTLTNANGFFRVNRAGSSSDLVSVGGTLTNYANGTITVTNLGATLQVGDAFALFNKAMSNGAALTVIGGGVAWSNGLAVNGKIVVVTPPDTGVQLTAPASALLAVNITNTITLTNIGPGTALSMIVYDTLPANVKFVSATGGGTTNANAGQVVWTGFNLPANTATNFTLVVNATTVGNATNTAVVASSSIDNSPANNTATSITVVTSIIIPTVPAHISSFTMAGANVVIGGTNGVNGGTYYLLGTTNVATPLNAWTALWTNVVSANGANGAFTFIGTNTVISGSAQQFYILSNTNK